MSEATSTGGPDDVDRPGRLVWYYIAIGLIGAAAVIGFAVLPQPIAGLVLTGAALLSALVDFLARRFSSASFNTRMDGSVIAYLAVVGVVVVGSLILVWTVVRNGDAPWLVWVLAGAVFVVILIGAWIVDGRLTPQEA
ncbi:hypothetical protein [Agromyces sp. Root81]|uniref:hypothetical protein n=1 Tax=Agromyces sp. Root81 TaxID=1736601 RepID=UPI0012F814BE|nr:hypothetical protein [Agromyces sp. Root81]